MHRFIARAVVAAALLATVAACTDTSRTDLGLPAVHATGLTGQGVTIADIDRGIIETSPAFAGRVVAEGCFTGDGTGAGTGFDTPLCPNGKNSMTGTGAAHACAFVAACQDHGQWTTGLMAGNYGAPAKDGVAPAANIIAVRTGAQTFCLVPIGQCDNHDTTWALQQSLDYVYSLRDQFHIAAVNISLGDDDLGNSYATCPDSPLAPSISRLRAAGIAVVVASGNDGLTGATANPACVPDATTVGATQQEGVPGNGNVAGYSDTASWVDLLATGDFVNVFSIDGSTYAGQGTSLSAPYVAGAMALLRQQNPNITVDQMEAKLKSTGTPTIDSRNGVTYSRINIARALGVS
jgi:subtilisin